MRRCSSRQTLPTSDYPFLAKLHVRGESRRFFATNGAHPRPAIPIGTLTPAYNSSYMGARMRSFCSEIDRGAHLPFPDALKWLCTRSPHPSPPLAMGEIHLDECLAARELGCGLVHEQWAPTSTGTSPDPAHAAPFLRRSRLVSARLKRYRSSLPRTGFDR